MSSDGYPKGRARREEILAAAARLFAEQAYRDVSLRQIASAAGITHPTLLHHFETKEILLDAVLRRRDELTEQRFAEVATLDDFKRLTKELDMANRAAVGLVNSFTRESTEAVDADHPAHEYYRNRYRSAVDTGATALGKFGLVDIGLSSEDLARVLIALDDGLQLQWLYDPDIDVPRLLATVTDLLLRADETSA